MVYLTFLASAHFGNGGGVHFWGKDIDKVDSATNDDDDDMTVLEAAMTTMMKVMMADCHIRPAA